VPSILLGLPIARLPFQQGLQYRRLLFKGAAIPEEALEPKSQNEFFNTCLGEVGGFYSRGKPKLALNCPVIRHIFFPEIPLLCFYEKNIVSSFNFV
jgi:hypothetical protein